MRISVLCIIFFLALCSGKINKQAEGDNVSTIGVFSNLNESMNLLRTANEDDYFSLETQREMEILERSGCRNNEFKGRAILENVV